MLILEILHTAFYYLLRVKLQGFGLDGLYKLNSIGRMSFWTAFSLLSSPWFVGFWQMFYRHLWDSWQIMKAA